jgi:hypothetical protein
MHELCDNKGPIVMVCQSDNNRTFGAYSSIPVKSSVDITFQNDPKAFMFSLSDRL